MNNTTILINYLEKILKKKKIVVMKDLFGDKRTPNNIRNILLASTYSSKLYSYYAHKKGITGINFNNTILAFKIKDEGFVLNKIKEKEKIIKEIDELKRKIITLNVKVCEWD